MKEKTKVYTYTRVSTAMQIDGYSLEAQKNRMKAYADFNDYEIVSEYEDAGRVSAEIARLHAETEFEKYRVIQDREFLSDYDRFLLELEEHADAAKAGPQEEKP